MSLPPLRTVLFDLDGTLVDHGAATTAALDAWLSESGVAPDPVHLRAWFAAEDRHFDTAVRGEITWAEQRRRRLRDFLPAVGLPAPEAELDRLFAAYYEYYIAHWQAFPDARAALERAHAAGLAVGILTNGDVDNQRAKLVAAGLADVSGPVFASHHLGFGKPDPRAYAAALAGLGAEPATTLMIGDNHEYDVLAPRRCGLRAIHLDRAGTGSDEHRVGSLDEVRLA